MKWMKRITNFCVCLFLVFILMNSVAYGMEFKSIRVGRYWDDSIQDNTTHAGREYNYGSIYYNNFADGWGSGYIFDVAGLHIGCVNWEDPVSGEVYDYYIGGAGHVGANEANNIVAVEDAEELTLHKYLSYAPPVVTVDGLQTSRPFPLTDGEEVNPNVIPGNAVAMIKSKANTMLGVTMSQTVLAWSQQNHDMYHIFDMTFTNTGNVVDVDGNIQSSTQTIEDFYWCQENHYGNTWTTRNWWDSALGELSGDTMNTTYYYPGREKSWTDDLLGQISTGIPSPWVPNPPPYGYIQRPWSAGEVYLFASSGANDWVNGDRSQPTMTSWNQQDIGWDKQDARSLNADDRQTCYEAMSVGFENYETGHPQYPDALLAYPGTYHEVRLDERSDYGYDTKYPEAVPWWSARNVSWAGFGPYDIALGDSIRLVYARVVGTIDPKWAWDVGMAWADGNADPLWDGAYKLPPMYDNHPDLVDDDNDRAKDSWVYSSKDSCFKNMTAAIWNFENDYTIPEPPMPPDYFSVQGQGNQIHLEWGERSESANDFAGYRIYRASGASGPEEISGQLYGIYELLAEIDGGSVNSYDDETAVRGQSYYYALTAYDDGASNGVGAHGTNQVLESNLYVCRSEAPAQLKRPPSGDLSNVRVVPNPFNIMAPDLQFPGEPDKIMFFNLTGQCTIRIFTESGDLVETLEHTDNTGDEAWGYLAEDQMISQSGQRVVSGIYVAYIEDTVSGESTFVKFVIVR